eukprot:2070655-Pyramimonas_sp.AAC.1
MPRRRRCVGPRVRPRLGLVQMGAWGGSQMQGHLRDVGAAQPSSLGCLVRIEERFDCRTY